MAKEVSINYSVVFPLRSKCIANIAVQCWKQAEIKEEIEYLSGHGNEIYRHLKPDRDEKFLQILKTVARKLNTLPLPNLLKEHCKDAILPVGREIFKWINSFKDDFWDSNSKIEHIGGIYFTNEGAVDRAKTIEFHLNNPKLDHIFEKACDYCLEEHIRNLWERMPKEKQDKYTENVFMGDYQNHLRSYWICLLKNKLPRFMRHIRRNDWTLKYRSRSIHLNMFKLSISEDNVLAAKYFWHKLTDERKQKNIVKCTNAYLSKTRGRYDTEPPVLMCFLLSQMSQEQQVEVLINHGTIVLESLVLHFPFRMFFFMTIQSMWKTLGSDVYTSVLGTVLWDIEQSCTGKFFKEVWSNSKMEFKKHFLQALIKGGLIDSLWNLFEIKDIDGINAIFNDANMYEKKQIIFSTLNSPKLMEFIYTGKLVLLQVLISKGMLSNEEIRNLKENMISQFEHEYWVNWEYKLQAIEEFLNWGFDSQEEVISFKIKLAEEIFERPFWANFESEWSTFERVINWLLNWEDEQINQFKLGISYAIMAYCVSILLKNHKFEFADKLLVWLFSSEKKIQKFKERFLFSESNEKTVLEFPEEILYRNPKRELLEQVVRWFHPYEQDIFNELKEAYLELKQFRYINAIDDSGVESLFFP